uniref:ROTUNDIFOLIA like 8 n=1 Tax=Musa acuminata subsp. malaccensis TaxID=214687 RepID=A0A804JP93_MUSAM
MEVYMDEKWKLSKKGDRGRRSMTQSFSRRCASLVKEQRARFYIMRRCVVLLICWRDYS